MDRSFLLFRALWRDLAVAIVLLALSPGVEAHSVNAATSSAQGVEGTIETLVVVMEDGTTRRHVALRKADGTAIALRGFAPWSLTSDDAVAVTGRMAGGKLFVDDVQHRATKADTKPLPASRARIEGTLQLMHADDFASGRAWWVTGIEEDNGVHHMIELPVLPDELQKDMRVVVEGTVSASGALRADSVTVVGSPALESHRAVLKASGTSQVLVILLKFTDTDSTPFTQAVAQSTMFTDTWSIAKYYEENSFGVHHLGGTVTPWLTAAFARPTSCDFYGLQKEGDRVAKQAGYNLSLFSRYVYVFVNVPACGWSGLGEVGGAHAWSNGAMMLAVIGHELGHTFGLGHASSASCDSPSHHTIGGPCAKSEYGDPIEVMGNQRAGHFNAAHKSALSYLPSGSVRTHQSGTATYTLSPLESGGPGTLAVQVPSSDQRTYWIEYRQPIGFDAHAGVPAGVTSGAYIHLGPWNEYDCDTCALDMSAGTATFSDAALPVGAQFVDPETGTTITTNAATGTALTVTVSTPSRPSYADVPASHGAYSYIEALRWNLVDTGCAQSPLRYCPTTVMTRADFARMLALAEHGTNFAYTASGTIFADVPASHPAAGYIEQLYKDGMTNGCAQNPRRFCPDDPIRRYEVAIFLARVRHGVKFVPPPATGVIFADEPSTESTAAWAEQLFADGITQGCMQGPRRFCPYAGVLRQDGAIFIQRAYFLPGPPS